MNKVPPQSSGKESVRAATESTLFRFLVGGAFNTGASFALYWLLMLVIDYHLAYAVSYVVGVGLSYVINSRLVFRVPHSARAAALYPLVYVAGYLAGAAVLAIGVEIFGIPKWLAPLMSVCAVLPLTYVLTRLILLPNGRR